MTALKEINIQYSRTNIHTSYRISPSPDFDYSALGKLLALQYIYTTISTYICFFG